LGKPDILYSYRLHLGSLSARDRELRIADRARYSMAAEAERRRFFAGGFDITLRGRHPWFSALARSYRQAGHNVMELPDGSPNYHFAVTRAFPKEIQISDAAGGFGVLRENRLTADGIELMARDAAALEYPLLALANSVLWQRTSDANLVK
jgi:hypothetical protein